MKLRRLTVFVGPTIYAHRPIVRVQLDGEGSVSLPADTLQERVEFLSAASKDLSRSVAVIETLISQNRAVHWADTFGALAVALQDDRFPEELSYEVKDLGAEDQKLVLIETNESELGKLAARATAELVQFLFMDDWNRRPADVAERLTKGFLSFMRARSRVRFNENTRVLIEAARDRGIPFQRLVPITEVMVYGQGEKLKRLSQCMGDTTSAVAVRVIARNKTVTGEVLRQAAVPVPRQHVIRTETDLSNAVKQIGYPLVVKGATVDHGASVTTGIMSNDELRVAIKKVQQFKSEILVEAQIKGDDYRLTVINGRLIAAARRTAPQIIGDGQQTVRQLIEHENARRRQLGRFSYWLVPLRLDDDTVDTLARQGHSAESIPRLDETVSLRSVANLSQGGNSIDVTDQVHPDVADVAERAARAVGLDMAGVDVMTTDITRPLSETRGAVLEVNNWPGLRPHYVTPTPPRDVAGAVMDYLFPDNDQGRIPTVAVTGTNGKTTTCRMLRRIFEADGNVVGMATTNELMIDGQVIMQGDLAGGAYASLIVKDPIVQAGVFEMARGALVQSGAVLDGYSVGVVTNVTTDHLGFDGIHTLKDMARVKRIVAEIARDGVVLNADDAWCVGMVPFASAPIWLFSRDHENQLVRKHLDDGGDAVVTAHRDGREMLLHCHGTTENEIVATDEIPATWGGLVRVNVENAASAAAAALAAGLSRASVKAALTEFTTSIDDSPGRFNLYKSNGITVVLDNAHNMDGLQRLISLLDELDRTGRILCHYGTHAGRSRAHLEQVMGVLAHKFDHYVVSDQTPREERRSETEVRDWLVEGLLDAGVDPASVEGTTDVWDGVSRTLTMARPGDVVFIKIGPDARRYWDFVSTFDFSD